MKRWSGRKSAPFSACQKSLRLFQTRFKNAVTFASLRAAKVQASPVARLAQQGFAKRKYVGANPKILALPQTFKVGAVHLCMKDDDLSNV